MIKVWASRHAQHFPLMLLHPVILSSAEGKSLTRITPVLPNSNLPQQHFVPWTFFHDFRRTAGSPIGG